MRNSAIISFIFLLLSFLFPFLPQTAYAGDLGTIVRIDRVATSKTTGGTICVTPESAGVEDSVQIVFPTGFTVNQTASNWTVSTSNLPTGGVPLPGIGTASSISGQTVTFPSNDLVAGTMYCFNFASGGTITTPSSTGMHGGVVRTLTSSNGVVDSREYAISIVSNDQISVTATVPANPTDFRAVLELSDPQNGTFAQNTELSYRLRYSSFLSTPSYITVEAEWDLGVIQGVGVPTEDILNYVVGSASTGYSNVPPIIDIVNRKITWTIPSFPANTSDQVVGFRLRTNDSYKSTLPVTFSVHGRVLGPGTQTADSTVTSNYYNSVYITPTPQPTCIPSECPTAAPTIPTPTPTPIPDLRKPIIFRVDIRSISSNNAVVFVAANKQSKARLSYGSAPDSLTNSVSSDTPALQHLIELKDLKPRSRYYFRAIITDENGKSAASDVYVFDTATTTKAPAVISDSLIISSGDVLLSNSLNLNGKLASIIIPYGTSYSFRFAITPYQDVKSIRALLRPDNVLGATSNEAYTDTNWVAITEINPGLYIGRLQSNEVKGNYGLVLQIQDFNGNIKEETTAKLYVVTPLTIINSVSKEGIENVKTTIYFYNYRLRKYELLSTSLTAIKNPNISNAEGVVDSVLPEGKYKIELSVLGYEAKTAEFIIGPNSSNYPIIELKPLPFNIFSYVQYTFLNAVDVFHLLNNYIDQLKASARYFELFTFGTIILFIMLAFFRISKFLGVSVVFLPFFALYHAVSLIYRPKHTYFVKGKVADVSTHSPIAGALLYFSHTNGKVITHTKTNSNGEFAAPLKNALTVKITISKKGYTTFSKTISKGDLSEPLTVVMGRILKPEKFGLGTIAWYIESLAGSLFEAFLVITLVIEILFGFEFGLTKALPCIVISVGNILLWAVQIKPKSIRRV